jgi:hypothetical protein
MRMRVLTLLLTAALFGFTSGPASADWAMNATVIEACSCPMFCQCYFNDKPASHGMAMGGGGHDHGSGHAFCKFNNAYKINQGNYGGTKLDGAKFWISGDLGNDFSKGEMDWAIVTFDKATTKEQRDGIAAILPHVFPVKWRSFEVREGNIDTWTYDQNSAHATLDGGKTAEVKLGAPTASKNDPSKPIVMHNLKYWGVPRNDGFVMMPNQVQGYRVGDKAYEFKNTNGFMVTMDINSKDVAKNAAAAK